MNAPAAAAALSAQAFKSDVKPVWCPGCGDFSVLSAITKALPMLALRPENVAIVSGIGCSSRIPAYTTCYGFHGVHGRALAGRHRAEGRAPRPHRGGRERRRRRLFDRRQPLPARLPPQRRSHLHRDGQPRLRHDQGPALAHHRARLAEQALAAGHRAARIPSAGDRARLGRQFHRARLLRRPERRRPADRARRSAIRASRSSRSCRRA